MSGPILKAEWTVAADMVVAAKATLRTLASAAPGPGTAADPLQKNDPWRQWLEKSGKARKTPTPPAGHSELAKAPVSSAPSISAGDISRLSAHIRVDEGATTCGFCHKCNRAESLWT